MLQACFQLAAAGGLSSCPCLTSYPAGVSVDDDQKTIANVAGTEYLYAPNFGLNDCAAHSNTEQPYCADANGAPLPGGTCIFSLSVSHFSHILAHSSLTDHKQSASSL